MVDRNFDGIEDEEIRREIDPAYNALADALEDAYYGPKDDEGIFIPNTGWRNGVSSEYMGIDPIKGIMSDDLKVLIRYVEGQGAATKEQCKTLFDYLHGAIFYAQQQELNEAKTADVAEKTGIDFRQEALLKRGES